MDKIIIIITIIIIIIIIRYAASKQVLGIMENKVYFFLIFLF